VAGVGETLRSQIFKEIECMRTALDSYEGRITRYNEEELEEERQTFVANSIKSLQSDSVLDDGAPQFMPPRAKKARIGAESKSDLIASLVGQMRMNCGAVVGSRDPDMAAASAFLLQQMDIAVANPVALMTESLSRCSEAEIEKIIGVCGNTNNNTKWEVMSRATLKQVYDMVQQKDLQHASLKIACVTLLQLIVTGGWANDTGIVSWTGEGGTVQATVSHILKDRCMNRGAAAGAAAAVAAADAARAANGEM
jgi:hypothetical protein